MSLPPDFDPDFATPAEWARVYRACGVQVVPAFLPNEVAKNQSWKRPLLKTWVEYQECLVPDEVFTPWYGPGGMYVARKNMGLICGRASDNIFVIDLDHHKIPAATSWWRSLMALHNNDMDLETVEQITGGGGSQKLYRAPPGWVAPTCKTPIGVDIRGQGGFAVLAPSLHDSGRHYEWLEGHGLDEMEVTPAPDWLLAAVEDLVAKFGGTSAPNGKTYQEGPQAQYSAFGSQTDGRETYMRDVIWAAVCDWSLECPIKPTDRESLAKCAEKYEAYEREVGPQGTHPPGMTKTQMMEAEGRGPGLFHVKWQAAMKQWDDKVYQEARRPDRPKGEWTKKDSNYRDYSDEFQKERVDPNTGGTVPIQWLDMSNWDNVPVPIRKWAIRDMVPLNQVGLFSGEGGTGKSIIELMKNVAHVAGKDWMGALPEQGPAFYLGAEDEAEEIHIRLAAVAKHYGTSFAELTRNGLKVLPLLGEDSMLCVQVGRGNHIEVTPLYKQLLEAAGDIKPKNISIDTLSRAFGGDEINRVQVYAFAMHMQAIAKAAQGSVTILSHPSLAGMANGSGISGSTAWHGAFRFRQYLKGVKDDGEGDPADDDLRELEFKKNQYGPRGRPVILKYVDGLFLPVNGATDPERAAREARVDGVFVSMLRRFCLRGDRVTHLASSPNYYAPKVFAEEPEARQQGFRKGELEDAMRRLMAGNRVLVETYGKESRRQSKLVLAPGT